MTHRRFMHSLRSSLTLDSSARAGRYIPMIIATALVAPSPALVGGSPLGLLSPLALIVLAFQSQRRFARLGRVFSGRTDGLSLHLVGVVIAGILVAFSSLFEPIPDNISRFIAKMILLVAVFFFALLYSRESEESRAAIGRGIVLGAAAAAAIAIFASVTSTSFFGEPLRPNREFVLPLPLPKTTGLPHSFGEVGVIFGLGIAFLPTVNRRSYRIFSFLVLFGGFMVGQSRNMLTVLAAILVVSFLGRRVTKLRAAAALVGLVALASPIVISATLAQTPFLAESLVGEGVFATNVEARLSLVDQVEDLNATYPVLNRFFGADRPQWVLVNEFSPHNHFVSLGVLDGYAGIAVIFTWFLLPALKAARLNGGLSSPEFQGFVAAVVGLSFYEGSFSAAVAIAIALLLGALRTDARTAANVDPTGLMFGDAASVGGRS